MRHKKFIVFRVAFVIALLIASGVFLFLIYFLFGQKTITVNSGDIIYLFALFFLLLAAILFQVQNIILANYAEREKFTWPNFMAYHTICVILDAFITVGLGIVLYSIALDLYDNDIAQPPTSPVILWFISVWFLSNLVSLIGSLYIRTHLRSNKPLKSGIRQKNFGNDG